MEERIVNLIVRNPEGGAPINIPYKASWFKEGMLHDMIVDSEEDVPEIPVCIPDVLPENQVLVLTTLSELLNYFNENPPYNLMHIPNTPTTDPFVDYGVVDPILATDPKFKGKINTFDKMYSGFTSKKYEDYVDEWFCTFLKGLNHVKNVGMTHAMPYLGVNYIFPVIWLWQRMDLDDKLIVDIDRDYGQKLTEDQIDAEYEKHKSWWIVLPEHIRNPPRKSG